MSHSKITLQATVGAGIKKVWDYYTNPTHIIHWNFADPSWHCPSAANDMRIGGTYKARMEAKDGSFGFDFEAIYTEMTEGKHFTYGFGGRSATVQFNDSDGKTEVVVTFDAENENPIEMQKGGWQAILNNFKSYTQNN
ncbi:SRPBCC family protein [Parasediminibacterium sp. JCM 36343]|uniref:SRPBCC family protein n=1 Tax=Parasediminibacterium sp. JCM 36343 TaxID=3374279 RepID=UPI0039789637